MNNANYMEWFRNDVLLHLPEAKSDNGVPNGDVKLSLPIKQFSGIHTHVTIITIKMFAKIKSLPFQCEREYNGMCSYEPLGKFHVK